ncbi:MAG TPA: hypothetical protein PK874_09960 [Desulfobacteraceae bacterium]|nr:hypothetical protein [Desulfobacteraceae bacterium]HPJ67022.1 hypothetical protein [Desulfobacteraceae bacterium]HPQ27288.1 hypothetical protein [Desulfobacteraceae bacterium]
MNKLVNNETENLIFPEGMAIDIDEGWRKLISRQFGGNPGRAFGELIQNLLDSYPPQTAWENRRGDIATKDKTISITDYGEGLSRERIKLICMLGGTDKQEESEKIGQFGVGFFSIFNPKLGTESVKVTTLCEDRTVELLFNVEDPEKRPIISTEIFEVNTHYSTRIEVRFNKEASISACLRYAKKVLQYYPCNVSINGNKSLSIWSTARESGAYIFKEGPCHGILMPDTYFDCLTVLCKYEHIVDLTLGSLATGGHDSQWDLQDYHQGELPVIPNLKATINCNDLILTISRDSFFLGLSYLSMVKTLSTHLLFYLDRQLDSNTDPEIILANHYTLRKKLKSYLENKIDSPTSPKTREDMVLKKLTEAKVYRLVGHRAMFSLLELYKKKSLDKPLFFSPNQTNLRWVGGEFRHDFIVIPKKVSMNNGAPKFYDELFKEIFGDIVNLDTISEDTEKINDLVERGIVDKAALSPGCKFIGERQLTRQEKTFINEMKSLFHNKALREVISKSILLPVRRVRPVFFEMDQENRIISAGLFDRSGKALNNVSNLTDRKEKLEVNRVVKPVDLTLGIRRDHPMIVFLLQSQDVHRVYYAVTFLAHELSLCQKLLVPYSPFYHMVKEQLTNDMRGVLIDHLTQFPLLEVS